MNGTFYPVMIIGNDQCAIKFNCPCYTVVTISMAKVAIAYIGNFEFDKPKFK